VTNDGFAMILHSASTLPMVKIDRDSFLRKELSKLFDDDIVDAAIATNPAQAGISVDELRKIARACINRETSQVAAISTAAGLPGGFAMAATVPADLAQFFGHILRVLQKLIYLYGWPELSSPEDLDDETNNELTLFIGVMFGVNSANVAIAKIAKAAAVRAEKQLLRAALTKGTIYPIVKKVSQTLGFRMTKVIFAKSIGKAIPVVGGLLSGGVTLASFRPMAAKLQKYLEELPFADVDNYRLPTPRIDVDDLDFSDIIDADVVIEDNDSDGSRVDTLWRTNNPDELDDMLGDPYKN